MRPMQWTLRAKLSLFVCLNALIGLLIVASGFSYIIIHNEFRQKGTEALQIAETVASIPPVIQAFQTPHPSNIINPLVERIRRKFGAQFIVVANMQLIRYSHPNPKEIGKVMSEPDDDNQSVLHGKPSISEATGTLGLSIRGKAPIFDSRHHQIGLVSVGFLVNGIWKQLALGLVNIIGLSAGAFVLSLIGAHVLSGHVKRLIFGMEPSEIAYLVQEQSAIMHSIQEGILAVDRQGRITACNPQAQRILGLETESVLGQSIDDVLPHARLCSVISNGPDYIDQPMIIGTTMMIVNRVPVMLNNEMIGAVVTFRDKMHLDQVEKRLEALDNYAEALRSQRHEFMNRLHTIAGLIQLKEYDLVRELIDEINNEQNQLLAFFANRIRDPAVLAIIVGKMHRAKELGIHMEIDPKSKLSDHCVHRDVVVTVLGNAIDNALEALAQGQSKHRDPLIRVFITDEFDTITLSVQDSGPGIDPKLGNRIFEDGVSTKGPGRGFGLSLCWQLVSRANGKLAVVSSSEGATLEMVLPKGESANAV
jgi:two-component system, CitB family, sensor kinase